MLTISPAAADYLRHARDQGGEVDRMLRIEPTSIDGGEKLRLSFVSAATAGDQVAEAHGVRMCVAPDVADSLTNAVLDLRETDDGSELVFRTA